MISLQQLPPLKENTTLWEEIQNNPITLFGVGRFLVDHLSSTFWPSTSTPMNQWYTMIQHKLVNPISVILHVFILSNPQN